MDDERDNQAGMNRQHQTSTIPHDAYEAASQATEETDYTQFTPQLRSKKKWPRILGRSLLVILVLAGIGAGGYWFYTNHYKTTPQTTNSSSRKTSPSSTSGQSAVEPTKSYDASDLSLSFSYPENWSVADTNGKLTATSPAMQLTGADGQPQTGQVILTISSAAAADFSMFKKGGAVAVLASQKVSYASPASTQRANTYISFLQYAATTTHGALDGIFVTGDNGYKYGQNVPEADVTKVDPDIRVTFVKCATTACSGPPTATNISSNVWSDSSFATPIVNMIKSLQLQ